MRQAIIYPTTTGERFECRRGGGKTKTFIAHYGCIGRRQADKPFVLTAYGIRITNLRNNEMKENETAAEICRKVKRRQLDRFLERMPADKRGAEVEIGGVRYVAAVRRLTPSECDRLQGVPEWYDWSGVSETQHYKMLGNGWQCDTIRHCWSFLPEFDRPIRVWSLFDGMSCGHIVLNELGIPLECYLSSEVDRHAIAVEKQNFPDMIQVGSVTDINVPELVEQYGVPDFLCGGSPCQSFSFSGRMKGMSTAQGEEIYTLGRYLELKAEGFEFEGQSYLFWEYMRILTELRAFNPGILFFLENVEMLEKWERCLSHAIGVRGAHIDSALVSAQRRRRIYWSNIRVKDLGTVSLFDELNDDPFEWPRYRTDIPLPEDRGIVIGDILQEEAGDRYYLKGETVAALMEKADNRKLRGWLEEPQFSVDELADFMVADDEYATLSDTEKRELAEQAYGMERQRLHDKSQGYEGSVFDE